MAILVRFECYVAIRRDDLNFVFAATEDTEVFGSRYDNDIAGEDSSSTEQGCGWGWANNCAALRREGYRGTRPKAGPTFGAQGVLVLLGWHKRRFRLPACISTSLAAKCLSHSLVPNKLPARTERGTGARLRDCEKLVEPMTRAVKLRF